VEELELVDDFDRRGDSHPPSTSHPEFQQPETDEGRDVLSGSDEGLLDCLFFIR
jgi:hypothetical protein